MSTIFGQRLKELRLKFDEQQKEIAEQFNVSRGMVSQWEQGKHYPEASKLIEIAEYFKVSIDYLMGLEKENRISKTDPNNSLTDEEKEIIDMYRKLPPDLKRVIFATEKQFAQEQEENNQLFTAHKKY